MSKLLGLSLLIEKHVDDLVKTKAMLRFATKWIDEKHRGGHKITANDYQEFLAELNKIEKAVK